MRKWSLQRHIDFLRKHFPLAGRVVVRVCAMEDCAGDIEVMSYGYRIRINKDDSLQSQKETLWHEWCHGLTGWSDKHQHTNQWGIWYARVYRKIQDEI